MSPPKTIRYTCHRCGLSLSSGPLPERRPGAILPPLRLYPLPEGWALITTPRDQDDQCRCIKCQKDVARGAPVELGRATR